MMSKKHVWIVLQLISVPENDADYDIIKGIYDSEEKAAKRCDELYSNYARGNFYYDKREVE